MTKSDKLEPFDCGTFQPSINECDCVRIRIELEFTSKKEAYEYLNTDFNKSDDSYMNRRIYETLSEYIGFDMKFEDFCRL